MIKRAYSYIIAAMIWGIPGINISIKGVRTYFIMTSDAVCRLIPVTIVIALFFFIVFRKVVRKYSERISYLPEKIMVLQIFPPRGWILLVFMMGLGIILKQIPEIPIAFTASFYSGLGPMLVTASLRFIAYRIRG